MRFAFALLLTSLVIPAGCAHGPCKCAHPAEVAKAPVATFAEVRGWGPLRWDMTITQARAALDEARIYYTIPDELGALERQRGEAQASRTLYGEAVARDEPSPREYPQRIANRMIQLELAGGWTGTITFGPGAQGQIQAMVLQSGLIDDQAAADALLADRAAKYGPATSVAPANATTTQHTWQNSATQLLLTMWLDQSTKKWRAYEQWTRLSR